MSATVYRLGKNLSRFRLITFDITDTLLKFTTAPAIQYAKTASNFGYPNINQRNLEGCFKSEFKKMVKMHPNFGQTKEGLGWKQWWQNLVINIFNEAHANIPLEELRRIADTLIDQYTSEKCWWKVDGADEIICKIKEQNKIVGVISNFDPRLHQIIKSVKLPEFDFVLTSYEEGFSKPDSRLFNVALNIAGGVKGTEALHIGNTLKEDYFGAINAGWNSVHISNSTSPWNGDGHVNRKHVFKNIRNFIEQLESSDISWT